MMIRSIAAVIVVLFLGTSVRAQSDTLQFVDDPVLAMLDSLTHNRYIASLPEQPTLHNNKFNYAADSIPVADPAVIKARLQKLNDASPFDLVYNDDVQSYINAYVVKRRTQVGKMLALAQLYYPIFEEKLDAYGLPLELKHLAVIESALNPTATSRAGARGLWQFMYTTGKMYNLQVDSYVDERCDPIVSTDAACRCLKDLYATFGDWQIVLAAYNAGPGNVMKAIRRAGGGKKTYWEIRPFLPRETQAYVPAFIAANYVMNYYAEHNLYSDVPKKVFFDVDTVSIKQELTFTQIEAVLGISVDELEFLNPEYKIDVIPVSSTTTPFKLTLPQEKVGDFVTNETKIYDYIKTDTAMAALAVVQVKTSHTVKKGETITSIARTYKCSVTDIRAWNGLKSNYIKVGQKLIVYTPQKAATVAATTTTTVDVPNATSTTSSATTTTTTTAATTTTSGGYKYYTVKTGDNLYTIAKATNTTVAELKTLNGFSDHFVMHAGDKIKIAKL